MQSILSLFFLNQKDIQFMPKRTQASTTVLWQPLSDKQAEVVSGGNSYSYNEWCNRTGKLVTVTRRH